jgi:hypothetical protein
MSEWIHHNEEIWVVICVVVGYVLGRWGGR